MTTTFKRSGGLALASFIVQLYGNHAVAADAKFYVSANAGAARLEMKDRRVEFAPNYSALFPAETTSDFAWQATFGMHIRPSVALEIGYLDLGKSEFFKTGRVGVPRLSTRGGSIDGVATSNVSVSGISMAAVLGMAFGNWELSGRAGIFLALAESDSTIAGTLTLQPNNFVAGQIQSSEHDSTTTFEFLAGLEASYAIGDHYRAKLEFVAIPSVGDPEETGSTDVFLLTLGLQYRW